MRVAVGALTPAASASSQVARRSSPISGSSRWYCERLSSPSSPKRPRMRRVARRKSSSAVEKASCSRRSAPGNP